MALSQEVFTGDLKAACDAACATVAPAGSRLLACVLLERGGRLRVHGTAGHAQIRDGIPLDAGILGTAFRSGAEVELRELPSDQTLPLEDGVCARICMPIRSCGEVVGVLDIEALRSIDATDTDAARDATALLGERIDALGGLPPESLSQRLARHVVDLSALRELDEIQGKLLEAAIDLAPLSSAMLLTVGRDGEVVARAASGPLARQLRECSREGLRRIQAIVREGNSAVTIASADTTDNAAPLEFRAAGIRSTAFIARGVNIDEVRGILVLADAECVTISHETVEAIELLTATASSVVRAGVMYADLSTKAATDPLTGLGHRRTFNSALAAARPRAGLAVLLIDVDRFKSFNDTRGHQAGDRALTEVAVALSGAMREHDSVFRIGGDEFAAIVRVSGEDEARNAAERLLHAVRATGGDVTVSVGAALAVEGECDGDLIGRADQALYSAKALGRDAIDVATSEDWEPALAD